MKRPHRCMNCGTHFVLKKIHTHYATRRRCPFCRSHRIYYDSYEWKRRVARRKHTCTCSGLHFPHRRASSVWCMNHPTGPTEEDYKYLVCTGTAPGFGRIRNEA
jgi:DNA-directed RNA polymerase subunit RPC12/RpoP